MTPTAAPGAVDRRPPHSRSTLRRVAVPSEHGGWSLTLEPVVLGLLVAWSWPGLALGAAALVAFVARAPLRVVLVDLWRRRWRERTRVAGAVAAGELVVLAVLLGLAASGAQPGFWVPLAAAVPLIGVELWFDMRSRSRRLLAELAGTVGIGSVAAAIALADGTATDLAVGLWCVVAARSVAAVLTVRNQIDRLHRRPTRSVASDVAQVVAVTIVAVAWLLGAVPAAAVVALGAVALFDVRAVRVPPPRPAVIGIQQMAMGFAVVLVTGIAALQL